VANGLREIQASDLNRALETQIQPRLVELLRDRARGHCMRVTDLDHGLMVSLCHSLRQAVPESQVYVLTDGRNGAVASELTVTSTQLVELRNPEPDGKLRSPLLVFLPANLRTSAEDSFGSATFEVVDLGDVYGATADTLLGQLPAGLRGYVRETLAQLIRETWVWADPVAHVRYLLTAVSNGADAESLGGALYELGLVPDFRLYEDLSVLHGRVRKNLECVRVLTTGDQSLRGRVLELGLAERAMRRGLAEFLIQHGADDPRAWTRRIVLDRANWALSFDKWRFEEEITPDRVTIQVESVDLPVVSAGETRDRLADLIGQQVLVPAEKRKLAAVFSTRPHPGQVQGLHHFTVQLVARDGGAVGAAKVVKLWTSRRPSTTVTLTNLHKVDFEDGWHFVRVLPWTESDDPVPIAEADVGTIDRPNESEPFYVLVGGEFDETPPQRAVPRAESLEHARLRLKATAILDGSDPEAVVPKRVSWAGEPGSRATGDGIEVSFGPNGTFHIPVSRTLKLLEQRILAAPRGPTSWRLQIHLGKLAAPVGETAGWPRSNAVDAFLAARASYFEAISGTDGLITQGADLSAMRAPAAAYAAAYADVLGDLRDRLGGGRTDGDLVRADLRTMLGIDMVRLVLSDYRGEYREAALLGPTHPLRALWLASWAQLGARWIGEAREAPSEFVSPTREALTQTLSALNFPFVLATPDGHLFTTLDNIHPFWALYAPARDADPRGLLGAVSAALGLPEPGIGGSTIGAELVASRLRRYLVQHPYVNQLVINAFNPGRAGLLAEAMLLLQREPAFSGLRYDVRLFAPDPGGSGIGDALDALLEPTTGTTSGEAADAFATPTESHMVPKLAIASRPTAAFRSEPEAFRAHVSLLFDLFPPDEVGASLPFREREHAPLHGLMQNLALEYRDDDGGTRWRRQPAHGETRPLPAADDLSDLLSELPALMSGASAAVATGSESFAYRPVVSLALDPEQRALIHDVHEVSDWVFTVDRNVGIEFFDHGGRLDRPDFLIDYAPGTATSLGHRLFITSRSLNELEAMLRPVLEQYGLASGAQHAALFLDQLRSLSGRLALKLLSASTQRAEVIGLALARLYLGYQGALANQIIVPLDAHLELFRAAKAMAEDIGDDVTVRRTDLALFDLNPQSRQVTCNLVEVKCYAQVGALGAYNQLKEQMTEQLLQSERVLQQHFDPERTSPDRPDRLLKSRQMEELLGFYLERGVRYGLIDPAVERDARALLATLEDGYTLTFTRSALVFDFEKPGTEVPEREVGVEFHRIGVDLIRRLVESVADAGGDVQAESTDEAARAAGLPKLQSAAFLVKRDRDVSTTDEGVDAPSQASATAKPGTTDLPVGRARRAEPVTRRSADDDDPTGRTDSSHELSSDQERAANAEPAEGPAYDVLLGALEPSPQYGILGESSGRRVALDLNQTHTISLFGVQGGGKSYTLGSIIEMACAQMNGINRLPQPLAAVIFHYSPTLDYRPEFISMVRPNSNPLEVEGLGQQYGAQPEALRDLVVLVPPDKIHDRRQEYPDLVVEPITFASTELSVQDWKFLMGAIGSQNMYMRQINLLMRQLRGSLTLEALRGAVEHSGLADHLLDLARTRLQFASEYIDDSRRLSDLVRPGRLIIVDLRDELIDKDEALGLFVVLLRIVSNASQPGHPFNKLVVFDEAHKYVQNQDLVAGLVDVVREMRHKGTSVLVASQDPPSVPVSLIELSSQIILHRSNSPGWLKHIQRANASLGTLTPDRLSHLAQGEAYVWSGRATDGAFAQGAVKVRCRPRVTQHGGATKTAVIESPATNRDAEP
jgi:DNA phosphorothioation-dependent restriction protein DptH